MPGKPSNASLFSPSLFKHPQILHQKPVIGLSQCLTGANVRYNAKSKRHDIISDYLSKYATLITICPEVGAGLNTPRPAVQLVITDNGTKKMLGVDNNNLDVTDAVQNYSSRIAQQYRDQFHAFIFKARSPSCGYNSTPIFEGHNIIDTGSGIFAQTVSQQWPHCLFYQEDQLDTKEQCQKLLLACYRQMDQQP